MEYAEEVSKILRKNFWHFTAQNMREYGFSLTRILPYSCTCYAAIGCIRIKIQQKHVNKHKEGKFFLIFLLMLSKHVHMDWKLPMNWKGYISHMLLKYLKFCKKEVSDVYLRPFKISMVKLLAEIFLTGF